MRVIFPGNRPSSKFAVKRYLLFSGDENDDKNVEICDNDSKNILRFSTASSIDDDGCHDVDQLVVAQVHHDPILELAGG